MKRWFAAALFMMLTAGTFASAGEAPPISAAQLQIILKSLDIMGSKQTFPAPTSQNLRLSHDPTAALPVVMVETDDHMVYFGRSQLNPQDYIIWTRVVGDASSSYLFSTRADFKLIGALYLHTNAFPQPQDTNSPQIQAIYRNALVELAKDVDRSPTR